jgi:ADP-heptose:LPS heptosyltransferase
VDPRLRVIHHIPHDRLNWGFVKRRVRMEGACFWERDSEPVLIDFAVEDLLSWPGRAVRSLARFPDGVLPEWRRHAAWRMRQAAFVHQAAKDIGWAKVARRTARVTLRRLRAWAKCATRPVISTTLRLVNGKLWPRLPGEPEHILIACQGFLGDTIVIGPMIDALRRQWPGARLTLLTNRHGRVLHGANSRLDEVIEISRPRFLADWERWKEVRRAMRRLTVDVMIVPYWHATPVWPLLVSQRAPAIGFDRDTGFRRQLWHSLLDRRVHKDFEQNEVANLLALGKALGAEKEPPRDLCIPPLPKPTPVVLSFLEEHGLREGGFTVLHMDGFGMGKVWPTTKWAALARRLSEEWPELRLVFVGLSRLRLQVHRLIEDTGIDAVNDCANRPLGDLAEIVRRARLVVSTDSGPKHMAILMKTPSVTLYGHTTPKQWGPWIDREMHRSIVSPGIDLRPEELGPRPIDHKISLISVDDVLSAVREALGEPAVVPPA